MSGVRLGDVRPEASLLGELGLDGSGVVPGNGECVVDLKVKRKIRASSCQKAR